MTKYDNGEIRPLSTDFSILKKLELEKQPVGIKFLYNKPEGVRKLDKNLAFCLMPEEAQNSGAFYVDETHFECAGPLCLGIANDDPFSVAGQIGTKLGLDIFQEARANRRIYEVLPTLKKGTCNYVIFAPVSEIDFEPHVSEETKRYGELNILVTHMNPDLAMSDELLKKTGGGNLFMVFGEPDVDIKKQDGKVIVEIKGVDVYDPTTGQIRNNSTDDIACWFIDTDYNEESFFVRQAYFTGAEEPYEKLKRALRAEIDEAAWSSLYSTVSHSFDLPKTGKIAIKVINHYGDEVLKVYEVN